MRLRRLQLRNYGSFDAADLDLATEPGRLTLIVAPNGAGKSVLRRAFHDLLFDIPLQSPMRFRHGYPGMALHAEAIDADGTAFGFGWVRGAKPSRVTTDPARFAALQRGVTPQQLEQLFALDTRRLRDGGTDLKGGTTLADALLAGTGELMPAKSVRAAIEARRQATWGQGKSKPPLNAAASRLESERKRARAAVQRPEKREREERELEDRREQHAAAKRALDAARQEARRLNRIARTRQPLQQLAEAEAWLAANPDTPALPAGLDRQLADARGALALAQATHDGAARTLALAAGAVDRIRRDPAATDLAERLAGLPGALGEAEKTAKDIAERRAELAARQADVRDALHAIGADLPPERAAELIPTLGLMAEARAAITQEAGLRKALDLAAAGVAKAHRARAAAEADAPAAAALPDGLLDLMDAIRADRANPAHHAAELDDATRSAAAKVSRLLALVPGWGGTAAALRALALPSDAAFERLDAARQDAVGRAATASEHGRALAAETAAARGALRALHERPIPDAARVAAARAERDRGMRLVLRRAFAGPPDPAAERDYAGAEPVALVYERHVRLADEVADRRTAELGRVQEAERLARELEALAAPLADAEGAAAHAARALAAAKQAWADAVAPLALDPAATMAELRHALAARLQLIEAMGAEAAAADAEAALAAVHREWAARLAALLAVPPEPLGALLGRADRLAASALAAERAAVKRQAALDAAVREARDAEDARIHAEGALTAWRERWAALLVRLQRPDGESADEVSAVLGGIATIDRHRRDAASLERRVDDMQDDLDGFARTVASLAAGLGESVSTPAETARALIARAAMAADAESAWRQAGLGLDQAQAAADAADAQRAQAAAALACVIAACGAATAEDAERRIAASRAHTECVARRDAARLGLADHGDGLPDAQLRDEAAAVPAEAMASRLQDADEAATAATARAEQAAICLDQLRQSLESDADATAAIDSRADYEAAIAEFGRRLEDQLVLNLASAMLGGAMRSVEEQMGGSSLDRVSQAFAAVTGGAYRLETQDSAKGEELHAVEHAYPEERKSLDELSEGTRDQLYLALRMVALRDHCAAATALPFIADDILQTFDDARAGATLLALSELAHDLQVIVLTHHRHLEQVAADVGDGRIQVLRLRPLPC